MSKSSRRRRQRIRMGIVIGVLLLVAGGVTLRVLTLDKTPADPTTDPRRAAGLAAFEAGDPQEVVAQLTPYFEEARINDPDARFALASAELDLAEDDPIKQIQAAMGLRVVLRDQPDHLTAAELLLPLLTRYPQGVEEEGLRLAETLLKNDSNHPAALRAKAILLPRTSRDDEALEAIRRHLEQQPGDVQVHRLALDVMKRTNQPASALLGYAEQFRTAGDDLVADLVHAYALLLADQRDAAVEVLGALAEVSPTDAALAKQQLIITDTAGMFGTSLRYLEKLHTQQDPTAMADELALRLFESGRGAEAFALIEGLPELTPAQRILKAMYLSDQGQIDQAMAVANGFASEQTQSGEAVSALLTAAIRSGTEGLEPVIKAGRELRDAGVSNAYLELMVAEAFQQSGQPDRAIARFQSALRLRPSWAAPCLGLAQLYLNQGNPAEAMGFAAAAVQRQPRGLDGRILLAEAFGAEPTALDTPQKQEVLTLIDQIQNAQPGEPRTLALRIAVLAGTGERDAAAEALLAALESDPPLGQSALATLIESAKRHDLDPEGRAEAAYVNRFGQTVAITMVQAQRLIEAGQPDAAVSFFDQAKPSNPEPEWDVNRALLLERIGSPEATAAWSAVGGAYPDNLRVQQAQLTSTAAWLDRSSIDQAIKRLRKIAGEEDAGWRIERANWLLNSADPIAVAGEADAYLDAALKIEPDSAPALALRGRSQRLLGNPRLAVSLLNQVITLTPTATEPRVELALAQRSAGSGEVALETARTAAGMPEATPNTKRRVAQFMIDADEFTEAASVLAGLNSQGALGSRDVFTLAQLYRQTQQSDKALALIEQILESPTPEAVTLAADLYAQAGQPERAEAALAQLDTLGVEETDRLRIRAAHASAYGNADAADAAWVALVQASPEDLNSWTQLVSHRLRTNRLTDAVASAQAAAAKFPNHQGFAAVVEQAAVTERVADKPGAAALSFALLEDDAYRGVAIEALKLIDSQRTIKVTAQELTDQMVALAEASPEFEALWVLSVSYEFDAGRVTSAVQRAEAGRQRFPQSIRTARLMAEAYGVADRWAEAITAAEAWKKLAGGDSWEADTLAARAFREVGRANAAVSLLSPYANAVLNDPNARPALTRELSLAWASTGRVSEARELLEPLLSQDLRWRMAWLDAAVLGVPSRVQAGQWLEEIEAIMPTDSAVERAALAQAWWTIGMRNNYVPYRDHGRAMAVELAENSTTNAELWFFVGTAAEIDSDFVAAERAYRRALAIKTTEAGASNNLAMLLTDHGGDLEEAERLIRAAIETVPNDANYYDTLAHVLNQQGRDEEARQAVQRAIELDPGNPAWQVRLNEINTPES